MKTAFVRLEFNLLRSPRYLLKKVALVLRNMNFVISKDHIRKCSLPLWYPLFEDITIKSRIIQLDEEFFNYLLADGVHLPVDTNGKAIQGHSRPYDDDYDTDESSNPSTEDEDDVSEQWCFPRIQAEIEEALLAWNRCLFIKLDWSSPRDACWMNPTGTLKCNQSADVYLMLKSSDFIAHDLEHAYDSIDSSCDQFKNDPTFRQRHLVLRKWHDIHPSMEFRCFVCNDRLVAISQRDYSTFYEFIKSSYKSIMQSIQKFWARKMRGKFFDESFYVFDVYLKCNNIEDINDIILIDINPFDPVVTEPLLFTWTEITSMGGSNQPDDVDTVFRYIESEEHARNYQINAPHFATNRVPSDLVWLSNGANIVDFADALMSEYAEQVKEDGESSRSSEVC